MESRRYFKYFKMVLERIKITYSKHDIVGNDDVCVHTILVHVTDSIIIDNNCIRYVIQINITIPIIRTDIYELNTFIT